MTIFAKRKNDYQRNIPYFVDKTKEYLSQGLSRKEARKRLRNDSRVAGIDPMTIILIIKICLLVWDWFKNRKADPKTTEVPSILLEVSDDHFRDDSNSIDDDDDAIDAE